MEEVREGRRTNNDVRRIRWWKLFLMIPRMLLVKPRKGSLMPKSKLRERFAQFAQGRWIALISASREVSDAVAVAKSRRSRNFADTVERRAERARVLATMGELSSARLALEGEAVAPGDQATLGSSRDRRRRPPEPREPIPQEILDHRPRAPFSLDFDGFLHNLRKSKKGAAAGPSGMTSDHLFPLLRNPHDSVLLCELTQEFARAEIPQAIVASLRMGRMTALKKRSGGIRGIVVGEILRRLVARTMAQSLGSAFKTATAPHQYALTTRSGCESIAHALQGLTDLDPEATVMSVDRVGAFDLISRASMMSALRNAPGCDDALPFVLQFYGQPSSYIWEDEMGEVHDIVQGEGGEQGDPLMPALFALGQHEALQAISRGLLPGEKLFAFLDDIFIVAAPERLAILHRLVETALWDHARIRINQGKTQIWNRAGVFPVGCEHIVEAGSQSTSGGLEGRPVVADE